MPIDNPDHWYLRKFDDGEIFGPIPFARIQAWARSAQVNPQDMLSTDAVIWNKAPMVPEMQMDWLVVMGEDLLYGPTTSDALLEFVRNGEINREFEVINCRSGETILLGNADFYSEEAVQQPAEEIPVPARGGIKASLQQRIRDLETDLSEKRNRLTHSEQTIARLETRVRDMEEQIAELGRLARAR